MLKTKRYAILRLHAKTKTLHSSDIILLEAEKVIASNLRDALFMLLGTLLLLTKGGAT